MELGEGVALLEEVLGGDGQEGVDLHVLGVVCFLTYLHLDLHVTSCYLLIDL